MSVTKVAKLANVSTATVSRVINGHPSVEPENVRRVKAAMQQLGYAPRAIRPGRVPRKPDEVRKASQTGVLGILLAGRPRTLFENPYMTRLLNAMTEAATMEGRHLMIIEMPTPQELPRVLRERQVDGLIITGRPDCQAWLDTLASIPLVILSDSYEVRDRADIITNDSPAIGAMAAEHLLSLGCHRPAFINHDPRHSLILARGAAFKSFLQQKGVRSTEWLSTEDAAVDTDTLWQTEWMRQEIGRLLDQMLSAKVRPDGVFFPTDHQTAVAYSLLRDRGLAPGQEIKIVSCGNNEPWLLSMSPRPATIDPGTVQEGREGIRRLIARISHPYDDPTIVLVKPRLVLP